MIYGQLLSGGEGRIRTYVAEAADYSLLVLTTHPPLHSKTAIFILEWN